MSTPQNNAVIELHVPNFEKVKDYYKKFGFKVIWERQPEGLKGYLVLALNNNILTFWGGERAGLQTPILKEIS